MDNKKRLRKPSITSALILWIVLASTAIGHLSSEAPLYVCAIASSVKLSRDATKDDIDSTTPVRIRGSKTTSNDIPQFVPHYQQQLHYHYHYDGREIDSNHKGRSKDAKAGCETPKRSKKIKKDNDTNCTTPSSSKSPITPVTSSDKTPSAEPTAFFLPTGLPTLRKPSGRRATPTTNPIPPVPLVSPFTMSPAPSHPPTAVTIFPREPSTSPTGDSTSTNTAEQLDLFGNDDAGIRSEYYFRFDLHEELHDDDVDADEQQHNNSNDDKKTIAGAIVDAQGEGDLIGNSGSSTYWIIGTVFCLTAYCGGIATSRLCWSKKNDRSKSKNKGKRSRKCKGKRNRTNGSSYNIGTNNSGTNSASIQLSVEESVDSYYHDDDDDDADVDIVEDDCDDWSVSVMSWSPREIEQDSIEVGPHPLTHPHPLTQTNEDAADADARDETEDHARDEGGDEIEIEFEYDNPEGYFEDVPLEPYDIETDTDTDIDEEDPPLFDVIDMSCRRISSF
jgi:hypothetical protein